MFLIGRTSKQAKHNLHTEYQPQIIKPHVVLVDTSLSKNHGIAERLMLYIVTTLTTDLLHVQCKEILLVLITAGPSVQTWIFISVFHYTCIRFRELIWNLYCSLIIKKNYQIWVLITMNKQKQKLILNDSCFFLYRVLPFENSLTKFYWSYLAFEIGGVGKGACTAYAIFSEYLLLEHTVKHRSMSSWRCQY